MDPKSQRPKGRNDALSKLNEAIEDLTRAKEASSISPAKTVFGSTSALLPTIRVSHFSICVQRSITNECVQDSMMNRKGYVELGLYCAHVCRSLDRGLSHKQGNQLGRPVFEAIDELTM